MSDATKIGNTVFPFAGGPGAPGPPGPAGPAGPPGPPGPGGVLATAYGEENTLVVPGDGSEYVVIPSFPMVLAADSIVCFDVNMCFACDQVTAATDYWETILYLNGGPLVQAIVGSVPPGSDARITRASATGTSGIQVPAGAYTLEARVRSTVELEMGIPIGPWNTGQFSSVRAFWLE